MKTLHLSLISILMFYVICSNVVIVQGQLLILHPLQQFKQGIPAQDVQCYPNFHLVLKTEDKSPACVKLGDVVTLVKRGWALNHTDTSNTEMISILTEPGTSEGFYKNGTATSVWMIDINIDNFKPSNSPLVLQIYYSNGTLYKTVDLSSNMIRSDGFYKYKLYAAYDIHTTRYYKAYATYDGDTAVTYAPIFLPP